MNGLKKAIKIVSFIYFFLLPTAMLICLVTSLVLFGAAQDRAALQEYASRYTYQENGTSYAVTEEAMAALLRYYATFLFISFLLMIPGLVFDVLLYRMTLHPEKHYGRGVWIRNGVLALVFGAEAAGILSIVYGAVFGNRETDGNHIHPSENSFYERPTQNNDYWNYSDRDESGSNDQEVVDEPQDDTRPKPSDYDAPDHPSDD